MVRENPLRIDWNSCYLQALIQTRMHEGGGLSLTNCFGLVLGRGRDNVFGRLCSLEHWVRVRVWTFCLEHKKLNIVY